MSVEQQKDLPNLMVKEMRLHQLTGKVMLRKHQRLMGREMQKLKLMRKVTEMVKHCCLRKD